MSGLSEREQRLVAVGLLVAVGVALWLSLVSPILSGFADRRDRRDVAALQLAHDRRLVAAAAMRRQKDVLLGGEAGPWRVAGTSLRAAQTAVETKVVRTAAADGLTLGSLHPLPCPPPFLREEVALTGGYAATAALVRSLEADAPMARVSEIDMATVAAADPISPGELKTRLVLNYAYGAGP